MRIIYNNTFKTINIFVLYYCQYIFVFILIMKLDLYFIKSINHYCLEDYNIFCTFIYL